MRQAYAHEALLDLAPDADERAPGAAVTVALCGHWEHEPPCPLSPHYTSVERASDGLHVRVLFAAQPEAQGEVRRRIDLALAGRWEFPSGFETRWTLVSSRPDAVSPSEADHAERLISS
jgi:hypothetical protein